MGTCTNAPMVQINDDNYERPGFRPHGRDPRRARRGETPKAGTQIAGRHTSEPEGGPTTLTEMVKANHDYRKEW